MTVFRKMLLTGAMLAVTASAGTVCAVAAGKKGAALDRGRYLAMIAGCNDCHTAGYLLSAGNVPEKEWLKGDRLGWNGPWGTTYAPNLRLAMANMSEEQWVGYARTLKRRPPMPWYALNRMTTLDLRAIYRLVRHLGPVGEPAPAYLPPGRTPEGPYVIFPQPPTK